MAQTKFSWQTIGNMDGDSLVNISKEGIVLANKDDPNGWDYASTVFNILGAFAGFLESNEITI